MSVRDEKTVLKRDSTVILYTITETFNEFNIIGFCFRKQIQFLYYKHLSSLIYIHCRVFSSIDFYSPLDFLRRTTVLERHNHMQYVHKHPRGTTLFRIITHAVINQNIHYTQIREIRIRVISRHAATNKCKFYQHQKVQSEDFFLLTKKHLANEMRFESAFFKVYSHRE